MDALQFSLFDPASNALLGLKDYREFKTQLEASNCRRCGLFENRQTIVVDRGNPDSALMLIGEGPGREEDIQGKAFVGRAGQLLDKMMEAIDLATDRDILIANIVKCRPPDNRTPQAGEITACFPYLARQIELVGPKVIGLLGFPAVKTFFKDRSLTGLGEVVGTFQTLPSFPEIEFFVLYHPAYLLRDPRKKVDAWQHLKILKRRLDQIL